MAKEFLNELLRSENCIKSDQPQPCVICLEQCGTLSSETGIIECLIKLPCQHLVGSHCIATWLHHSNSCPVCRRELFPVPVQRQARLEDLIWEDASMQGDDDDDVGGNNATGSATTGDDSDDSSEEDDTETRLDRLLDNTRYITRGIGFSYSVERLAQSMANHLFHMDALRYCRRWHKAAVANFVAAHVVYDPVRFVAPLNSIVAFTNTTQGTLLDTYRLIYPKRGPVINGRFLFFPRGDPEPATRGDLPAETWPLPEFTDGFWDTIVLELGIPIGTNMIEDARELFLMLVNSTHFDAESVMNIAALSVYVASCSRNIPTSQARIASAVGVNEADLRSIYALFDPRRQEILEHRMARDIAARRDSQERLW